MQEKKTRGRVKGSTSLTTIRDEKIEPYFIQKDKYGYTVFVDVENNINVVGHYSSFGYCLRKIAVEKIHTDNKFYESIQDYLNYYEKVKLETEKLIEL